MTTGDDIAITEDQDGEVERLLATLQQEGKRRKPLIRRSIGLLGIFVFGLFLVLFLSIIVVELSAHRPVRQLLPGVLLLLGFILFFHGFSGSPAQLQAARRLVEIPDKRAVGMLLDMTHWHDVELQERAFRMLLRLLPQLDAADVRRLSRYQSFRLAQALRPDYADTKPDFVLVVLDLMERFGDPGVLPFVRVLTRMTAETEARQRVKSEAIRCCAAIEARGMPVKAGTLPAQSDATPNATPSSHPLRRPKRPQRDATDLEGAERQKLARRQRRRG